MRAFAQRRVVELGPDLIGDLQLLRHGRLSRRGLFGDLVLWLRGVRQRHDLFGLLRLGRCKGGRIVGDGDDDAGVGGRRLLAFGEQHGSDGSKYANGHRTEDRD